MSIADSYTASLLNYQEAYDIAMNLLEEKILVASRAVLLIDDNDSTTSSLIRLAEELQVEGIGEIPPIEFIDLAEKNLLIYDLGKEILSKACDFAISLKEEGFEDQIVAINISLIQLLREEFIKDVHKILMKKGVSGEDLEFEITESILAESFELINEKLAEVKRLGIP